MTHAHRDPPQGRDSAEQRAEATGALHRVLVVGAGLMGTSAGLALRSKGVETYLADRDAGAARLAADLGAGWDEPPPQQVDLAILAVPPQVVPDLLVDLQGKGVARAYTDLASTKGYVQRAAAAAGVDLAGYIGGHPMAGRERSGPAGARADLFEGRPWVLTPTEQTAPVVRDLALDAVRLCGGHPVVMEADEHDRAVALISHAPHLLAALMAARLEQADEAAVALAGTGIRDVTRIAASDPELWRQILATNAPAVAEVLDRIGADLRGIAAELGRAGVPDPPLPATAGLLARGRRGEARLPGKHGTAHVDYAIVPVVLPDRPGQLARLFTDAGEAGVNIEDVRIEHSPGQPVGLVALAVQLEMADRLAAALAERGWTVHPMA
jgi:prephenate dehydrogenase